MGKLNTTGNEHVFTKEPWSKHKGSNNCYAYAMGDFRKFRLEKSVPGVAAGLGFPTGDFKTCGDLPSRVIKDNKGKVKKVNPNKKCPKGHYKIMMFISRPTKKTMGDFHFYKQHSVVKYIVKEGDTITSIARFFDVPKTKITRAKGKGKLSPNTPLIFKANMWSHKRGWGTGALLRDNCNKTIKDPRKSCKDYGSLNYNKLCSAFCVKGDGTLRVGRSKHIRPTTL